MLFIYLRLGSDCNELAWWNDDCWTIYEVFYSWFNWQHVQVSFKGHLAHHLLAQSPKTQLCVFCEFFHCLWVTWLGAAPVLAVRLYLRRSLLKKGAEKLRCNLAFHVVNVQAFSSFNPKSQRATQTAAPWGADGRDQNRVEMRGWEHLSLPLTWDVPMLLIWWWGSAEEENPSLRPVYVPVLLSRLHKQWNRTILCFSEG